MATLIGDGSNLDINGEASEVLAVREDGRFYFPGMHEGLVLYPGIISLGMDMICP